MKKLILPLSMTMGMGLVACGPMQQDPLTNHPKTANSRPVLNPNDLVRQEPEKRIEYVPQEKAVPQIKEVPVDREVPVVQEKIVYVDKEVPVIQEKIVYVEKEVAVDRPVYYPKEAEANYAAAQLFQITTNHKLSFIAGTEAKVPFEIRMLQGNIDFSASLTGLPDAELKEVGSEANKKSYQLIYKPAVNTIAGSSLEKNGTFKIQLKIHSVKDSNADKEKRLIEALKVVSTTRAFDYVVRRDARNPKLQVVGFPSQIKEGDKQAFSIKVTAPGTYEGFQPNILVSYDHKAINGNLFENSGTPFIRPSTTKPIAEKTGDGEWTFNYELDTNLFAVPAQLDKNMQKISSADSVALRVSFQVISPTASTSDVRVLQYKIVYKKEAAATAALQ